MSKKVRFFYHYLSAVFRKQWRKLGFLILLLGVFIFALGIFTPIIGRSVGAFTAKAVKPVFREAVVGNPKTFNPLFSRMETEKEINSLVFSGLTRVSADGSVVPDLAESIEIQDNVRYIFKLKKDIHWHDGKKFSADDVIYTMSIVQNQLYDSVAAESFRDVEVKEIDEYTVSFKLKEPFAPFLTTTTLGIIPKHIPLTDYRPIGTGEFRFVQIEDRSVTLENSNIKLNFQFYPNEDTAILALKLGEAHSLSIGRENLSKVKDWKKYKVESPILPYRLVTLFYNTRESQLKEKNVRQALTYAIDKNDIVKSSNGPKGKMAANSYAFLSTLQAGTKEKYSYDLNKANTLLSSEGWVLKDGKRVKDGKQLSLAITILADQEFEDAAKKIKSSWEKLGIDVVVTAVSGTELKDQTVPNRIFAVLLTTLLLNPDPDQYVIWHTTQASEGNISGISSPKLDKLLEDARKTLDPKVRTEKYQEFSKFLLDEAPAVFLYYPNYNWVYSSRLDKANFSDFHEPVDRFKSAKDWILKRPII